jgi:hypothetical protein
MNGSQKQISWAEDIQKAMIAKLDTMRRQFVFECSQHGVSADSPDYQAGMQTFARAIAIVSRKTDARWFIDNRQVEITRKWVKEMAAQ